MARGEEADAFWGGHPPIDFSPSHRYHYIMMDLLLTAHAEVVITERNIQLRWIRQVLNCPEKIEVDGADPELAHALAKVAEHGDRVLRVVHSRTLPTRIITAYFDRTMRGKL